jgi:hypothetical protein
MLAYHRARLTLDAGDADSARRQLDALLADTALPLSARNQTLALRMRVARDEGEFFRYAQRRPAGIVGGFSGMEYPEDASTNPAFAALLARTSFDTDSTAIMNRAMPLAMLTRPLAGDALPPALRREVALAAWTRAIVLKDETVARTLAPTVAEVAPELKPRMNAYTGAATPVARRVEAIYTILWNPGMRPYVAAGGGRTAALGQIDDYRDNWWCSAAGASAQWFANKYVWSQPSGGVADQKLTVPAFFSAADRDAGASEASRLAATSGPNLMLAETIAAVKLNPADSRNPEALHRTIMSVRYGCGDANTAKWSKAAFDLLHSRYPKSEWAAKTKFWFK